MGMRAGGELAGDESGALATGEQGQDFGECGFDGDAVLCAKSVDFAVLDEIVGPADANDGNRHAHVVEGFDDGRAEAAHLDVVFEGDEAGDAACVKLEHFAIERLDETGIDDGGGEAFALEALSQLLGQGQQVAESEDGEVGAVGDDLRLADGKNFGGGLAGNSGDGATWIADGAGTGQRERSLHHVGEFVFVAGRHENHFRNAAQVSDVEEAVVGGAIVAGEPGAIHAEEDGELLQGDVVDDGIECALEKRGIDGADGTIAARGHSGGEDYGVFFGNADVEVAARMMRPEEIEAGAVGHGGSDGDDAGILVGQLDEGIGEDFRVSGLTR